MRIVLLITALTLAQAQTGNSQAARSPAGSADRRQAGRAAQSARLDLGPTRGRRHQAVLRPSLGARPQGHGRAGPVSTQPWRLGANEATTINVPFAAQLAGVRVEPGIYTLYAIPGASKWQIVVNRGVQRWGVPIDSDVRARDVGAGTVATESLGAPVETLTLKFAPAAGNATELVLEWEKTRVRIPIRRAS